MARKPIACRLLGHRWDFWREGSTLRWTCARGCEVGGTREYADAREAARYLRHLERAPGPPTGFLAALGGTVHDRRRERR